MKVKLKLRIILKQKKKLKKHKKLSESHFVKLCLKSLSKDVLALCKEKQLKTGIDMNDIVDKGRNDDTLDNRKTVKRKRMNTVMYC